MDKTVSMVLVDRVSCNHQWSNPESAMLGDNRDEKNEEWMNYRIYEQCTRCESIRRFIRKARSKDGRIVDKLEPVIYVQSPV